jgi:putative ABC transport system permease protein
MTTPRIPAQPISTRPSFGLRWRTLARVGLRMMFHDKLKMVGTLAGVVFAVLLSNQQAGTFMGLIYKNVMFVENCDADIWIAPPGTEAFQPGKPIPESYVLQARVVDGVAWADPLLYGASTIALPSGGAEAVTLVGTKAPDFHGGPWNVVVGDPASIGVPDRMFFEHADREKFGGINQGSVRELGGKRVVATGFTWGLIPFGPSYAFGEYNLVQQILHVPPDQTSFGLVGVEPGRDPEAVAAALQLQLPDTTVLTRAQYRGSIIRYILTRTAIGITFGTSALFGLIIGFVIVSLSMFSAVLDNVREFGTLKAIGATTRDLARLLVVQAITYAIIGSVLGLSLVTFVAGKIRSPQLAVFLPAELLVGTTVVMILMCVLASSLALLRLRKVEPGMVFR